MAKFIGYKKQPLKSHKVCSLHFPGGKKTNALPSMPMSSCRQTKNSRKGIDSPCPELKKCTSVQPTEENLQMNELQALYDSVRNENNNELQKKYDELSTKYNQCVLQIKHVIASDANFKFYTSFPNYATFRVLFDYLQPACNFLMYTGSKNTEHTSEVHNKHGRPRSLSPEQELFMVLVRLRCGLLSVDIANRFGISQAQYSRIENTWLAFLYHRLRALPIWASHEHVQQTMPQSFRDAYPKNRVIIDCTEIYIEMPTSFRSQSATYSSYKNHNTAKGLIGISPAGYPSFISELYAGHTSDKQITKDCGILCMLEPGDDLMADRGFDIEDDMPDGVTLNIPPFLNGAPQLSVSDENETRRIAAVGVHVERAIQRIKCFRILKSVFPLSMASQLNKIWIVCSYLTLFHPPLISEKPDLG